MNKNKSVLVGLLMVMLTGCASLNDTTVKSYADNGYKLSKDGSGIVYGTYAKMKYSVKEMCAAINNSDSRCESPEKYVGVQVFSAFGFAASGAVATSLEDKDSPNLVYANTCTRTGDKTCSYVKVQTQPGKFGTVLEVASKPNENKCYWTGMARAGGVVCPAYNWDYKKDLNDWDTTNGVMTVNYK